MLRRFVSAATVASVALMIVAVTVSFLPTTSRDRITLIFLLWLCVPTVWGVWAVLAPKSWVPHRLPSWGAILGLMAGATAAFVIDVPYRVAGATLSTRERFVTVLAMVAIYYVLWMIVRGVLVKVIGPATAAPARDSAHAA